MKKQKAKKLHLSRETLRSLEEARLRDANGAVVAVPAPISFWGCTNIVSDCYACTGRLDTCPQSRDCTIAVA
ncbi:MAG TPA: hypothetical protein VGS07_23815 [Thermoanaerobaculia bacterium]|jgi:hypothetical protein|nr:hypothetical protein [Thermoanaerobaculia bacterium]